MELTIPVYNKTVKKPGQEVPVHQVCALFHSEIRAEDVNLRRAWQRLDSRLRKALNKEGRSWNHQALSRLTYNPDLKTKRCKLVLDMKSRRAKMTVLLVRFKVLDRLVAFSPGFPDLWFDLDDDGNLESRARDEYQSFFRKTENDANDGRMPEQFSLDGEQWISWMDVNVRTDPVSKEEQERDLLALFSGKKMDGASELTNIGRCLDRLYPEELQRTMLRESEVQELDRLLNHSGRRPVLIVGPHHVGKTALVHEVVYQRVHRRAKKNSTRQNTWHLSPQRLISGMSFVGQWEDRLLAILEESNKRDHVLYFDDLISMFRAGQSRDSNLSVADLIKNSIQERQVRIVAELTHEAFHILESKDRGLADLFHVIRLNPTSAADTRQIGMHAIQRLEMKYRCVFDWKVLEEVTRMQERYVADAAMPGKLLQHLEQLAAVWTKGRITVFDAHRSFRVKTGLSNVVFSNESLQYTDIASRFRNQIIGQKRAKDVCGNVVAMARAGLNEPGRPLATLLFLGPTGVGKTECAKALSNVMYTSENHLIRFDLNQFKTAWSASTLVGTPDQPEGLLTSEVRQKPFSILLLDEIEKAHPSVFDILLQVLGEGRLTDAMGRTTDFSNCVIVMTSNLGTRRNQQSTGFSPVPDDERFEKAARDFFRPEFYNRIDEIVPFSPLSRSNVRLIANKLIGDIVGREGLTRRYCVLQISKQAIDHVVELGYHPELGARAMKRALEDKLTRLVSRTLASTPIDQPTIVRILGDKNDLRVNVRPLQQMQLVRPEGFALSPKAAIDRANAFISRIRENQLAQRPDGEIGSDGISPLLLRYFALDEQAIKVESLIHQLEDNLAASSESSNPSLATQARFRVQFHIRSVNNIWLRAMKEVLAARDIHDWLNENQTTTTLELAESLAMNLVNQSAVLNAMVNDDGPDSAVLYFRPAQTNSRESGRNPFMAGIALSVQRMLNNEFGFEVQDDASSELESPVDSYRWLKVDGPCVGAILEHIVGSYSTIFRDGKFRLFHVGVVPPAIVEQLGVNEALETYLNHTQQESEEPDISDTRRLIVENGPSIDFCTGISIGKNVPTENETREVTLGSFPLPEEFNDSFNGSNPSTPNKPGTSIETGYKQNG